MKQSEFVRTLVFGAALLMCSFAALAFLVCVLSTILSLVFDDPRGPGPMGLSWRFVAVVSGMITLIVGLVGYIIMAVSKSLEKEANSHSDANSN